MARFPVRFVQGDVRDAETVQRMVDGCHYVFHEAAIRITRCAEVPRECIDVLVTGTLNVFEAAVKAGVRKVVYASSASVYGGADEFPTSERHHPYNNRTLYGASKLMDEGIAHAFKDTYGLASVGLRYFNVFGPRMDVTGAYTEVFIRWMDCIDRGEAATIHGDGTASMDLIYVDDVARANILAAESDRTDDVYNVGSGTEVSLLSLWRMLQEAAGSPARAPQHVPPRKVNPVPRRLADVRRAAEEIGFKARVPVGDGLQRLIAWRRDILRRQEVA
jgi:UDP-glucose 4-epimerase